MEVKRTMGDGLVARDTAEKIGGVLDRIPPVVIVVDRDNRIVFQNRRARRCLGLKRGDIVEKIGGYRMIPPGDGGG